MKLKQYVLPILLSLLANHLYGQGDEAMPPPDQSLWQTLVMILVALVFFYFILWRPEQKRRKAAEEQREALKKGDRVIAMGIIGTVMRVGEQTVILKMYDGAKIEFLKSTISDVIPPSGEGSKRIELISEDQS